MLHSIVISTHQTSFKAATFSGSLERNLESLSHLGYQGVELAVREPQRVDPDVILRAVGKFHLQVSAIGTGQAWNDEKLSFTDPEPGVRKVAVERVLSHIVLASRLNSLVIIGLIRGTLAQGVDLGSAHAWMKEALAECAQKAEDLKVRMVLEPINRYETALINKVEEGLALLDSIGSSHLGLLLDAFHMNIEEVDVVSSILRSGKRIFHFHVADSNRQAPGRGHIDFRPILSALNQVGYQGFLSGEFLAGPDALQAAETSITHLKKILSEINA